MSWHNVGDIVPYRLLVWPAAVLHLPWLLSRQLMLHGSEIYTGRGAHDLYLPPSSRCYSVHPVVYFATAEGVEGKGGGGRLLEALNVHKASERYTSSA